MVRTILTFPLNSQGPKELQKLIDIIQAGYDIKFEGSGYVTEEPDGLRMLCFPICVEELPPNVEP